MKQILYRYAVLIALLICISFSSWWLVLGLAVISAFIFDNFFELIALGIVYDIVFHVPGIHWYAAGLHTLIMTAVVIVSVVIHKLTRKPNLLI